MALDGTNADTGGRPRDTDISSSSSTTTTKWTDPLGVAARRNSYLERTRSRSRERLDLVAIRGRGGGKRLADISRIRLKPSLHVQDALFQLLFGHVSITLCPKARQEKEKNRP